MYNIYAETIVPFIVQFDHITINRQYSYEETHLHNKYILENRRITLPPMLASRSSLQNRTRGLE